jgi:hypothetical protein
MDYFTQVALLASAVSMSVLSVYWLVRFRSWSWFLFGMACGGTAAVLNGQSWAVLLNDSHPDIISQNGATGASGPLLPYVWLYGSMLSGMLAQSAHDRFSRLPSERVPFDVGVFLAPVFVSPIIFVPLFQSMGEPTPSPRSLMLTCLVAFENGFFFKHYLDQKHAKARLV